jgi:hypothetical protein
MKLRVRSDDASSHGEHGWSQMGDWLAQLRDDSRGEPPGDGHAGAGGADHPRSEALAQADVRAEAGASAQADVRAEARAPAQADVRAEAGASAQADVRAEAGASAQADVRAEARAPAQADVRAEARAPAQADASVQARGQAEADARVGATERAVIGDQLRIPIMWCEMGSCISWYTDPDALGDADTRARAIGAGWRIDALGRLACPQCQQTDPCFWASRPVVPWDRYMAVARAGRVATASGEGAADSAAGEASHDPGRAASGFPPVSRVERGWHHDFPNARATRAGRYTANPAATLIRVAWPWGTVRARQARGGQAAASPSQ